jgi:hypothetical protein
VAGPVQGSQVDIGEKAHRIVVEGQVALDVNSAGAVLEVGLGQVGGLGVQAYSQIRAAARVGELDVSGDCCKAEGKNTLRSAFADRG